MAGERMRLPAASPIAGLSNDFLEIPSMTRLTDNAAVTAPCLSPVDQMATMLDGIEAGQVRELLFVGVVGTFAVG